MYNRCLCCLHNLWLKPQKEIGAFKLNTNYPIGEVGERSLLKSLFRKSSSKAEPLTAKVGIHRQRKH